jgi:hypothetical protein
MGGAATGAIVAGIADVIGNAAVDASVDVVGAWVVVDAMLVSATVVIVVDSVVLTMVVVDTTTVGAIVEAEVEIVMAGALEAVL